MTTDRATRLRGRNTCSKLAATSRRRGERRKRERRVENRKDFFEKERREREKKSFIPRGKGIKRVFIRVEEFVNSFANQSESLFFSAILNHLLTLERNPRKERSIFSSEGKERKSRNVSSQVSSIPQKEKNSRFRGKERKENRGAAKPITRNQGIITVASERHKSDTNRVSRFNASSPL